MGSQVNYMLITLYDVEIIPFKGDIPEDSFVVETYDSAISITITYMICPLNSFVYGISLC